MASGASYRSSVVAQPATLACTVANATGTVGAGPVAGVAVSCACQPDLADCDGNPGTAARSTPARRGQLRRLRTLCKAGETCQARAPACRPRAVTAGAPGPPRLSRSAFQRSTAATAQT